MFRLQIMQKKSYHKAGTNFWIRTNAVEEGIKELFVTKTFSVYRLVKRLKLKEYWKCLCNMHVCS